MKIEDKLNRNLPTLKPVDSLSVALSVFQQTALSFIAVVNEQGYPCGIVSAKCLLFVKNWDKPVMDIMYKDITTIASMDNLENYLNQNNSDNSFPLIVVDSNGKYQGILAPENIISALYHDVKYIEKILDSIDAGIIAVDEEKKVIFFNKEWKRIHSIKDKQLLGEDIMTKFPETLITAVLKEDSSHNINPKPLYLKYSGATVLPYYRPIIDDEKGIIGSVAIVKDYEKTSDMAISLRELTSLNNLFSSIFNNLYEMVFSVDTNNMITYANPAFTESFGQLAGEPLQIPEFIAQISNIFQTKNKKTLEKEITLKNKIGFQVDVNLSCLPLTNSYNITDGVVCIIQNITSIKKLKHEIKYSSNLLNYYEKHIKHLPHNMVCKNQEFQEVLATALKVAKVPITVLIEGENGVGKDLVANFIHMNSDRADKPFIPVNCGAIPENLWESEMFGYEEGSFTGSKKGGKLGIFELANHGTVFLDEISEISLKAQVKMLRFIENMEISKVGRKEVKKLDVRIIAATNRSLLELVDQNLFRMDLYYRLNVVRLHIPPLRKRKDEILLLADHFIEIYKSKYNKEAELSPETAQILLQQEWTGNVRQLRNVIEHGVVMCDKVILPSHLPQYMTKSESQNHKMLTNPSDENFDNLPSQIKELEIQTIKNTLEKVNFNKTKAIELLKISRKTFYKKLKEYGLENYNRNKIK